MDLLCQMYLRLCVACQNYQTRQTNIKKIRLIFFWDTMCIDATVLLNDCLLGYLYIHLLLFSGMLRSRDQCGLETTFLVLVSASVS